MLTVPLTAPVLFVERDERQEKHHQQVWFGVVVDSPVDSPTVDVALGQGFVHKAVPPEASFNSRVRRSTQSR